MCVCVCAFVVQSEQMDISPRFKSPNPRVYSNSRFKQRLNHRIIRIAGRYLAAVSQNSALYVNTVEGLAHSTARDASAMSTLLKPGGARQLLRLGCRDDAESHLGVYLSLDNVRDRGKGRESLCEMHKAASRNACSCTRQPGENSTEKERKKNSRGRDRAKDEHLSNVEE